MPERATARTPEQAMLDALSMLVSGCAGRPLSVFAAGPGEPAHTDGTHLFVDPGLDAWSQREASLAQGLLLAGESLSGGAARRLMGRPQVARRYMALEMLRTAELLREVLPGRVSETLAALAQGQALSKDPDESLAWAADKTRRVPTLPAHFGVLRLAKLAFSRVPRGAGKAAGTDTLKRVQLPRHDEDTAVDEGSANLLRMFSSPLAGGAVGNLFVKLMGFGRSPGGDDGNEDSPEGGATALGDAVQGSGTPGPDAQQLAAVAPDLGPQASVPQVARFRYPEWHRRLRRYRRGWVHLHELLPAVSASGPTDRVSVDARSVRRQLVRVGVELERHRGQTDGDELDLEGLIRFAVERRTGDAPDRVHVSSRRTRRDLSLLVLLDVSGSTADRVHGGGSIFGQQRELAREIVRACHGLGDRVALYGFHSFGRHQVRVLRLKRFDEGFGRTIEARLDGLEPGGLTRMGAAIRHATHLMDREAGRTHRVMLLLSDGFAYDDEYSHGHAEADTRLALQEAARAGIGCVCLNVGTQQDDPTLQRLYGSAAYLRCSSATEAVPSLGRLMRSAMAQARRAGQRTRHRRSA